jgi:ATP-binding protein involved in chromosome partitioning
MGIFTDVAKKFKKSEGPSEAVTEADILKALAIVVDPDLHKDIVTLGFVRNIKIVGNDVSLDVNLTTPACPVKELLKSQCIEAISSIPGIGKIAVTMTAVSREHKAPTDSATSVSPLAHVKSIIAVASGKGGVGKSTTAINIARALAKRGAKVGVMDADVYGPSIPHVTKVASPTEMRGNLMVPPMKDGIKMVSVSMFASAGTAQILRGPMAGNVAKQFLTQVEWGELDYLIIDYPPGTGDIQLTISQTAPVTGAIIVTTPQEMALIDVRKAISMFETLKVPVLGVIENMSYFLCDGCDKKHFIFGKGGGKKISEQYGIPLLGEIPMDQKVVEGCDNAESLFDATTLSSVAIAFQEATDRTIRELAIMQNKAVDRLDSFHLTWQKKG